jgi:hypothetical protein
MRWSRLIRTVHPPPADVFIEVKSDPFTNSDLREARAGNNGGELAYIVHEEVGLNSVLALPCPSEPNPTTPRGTPSIGGFTSDLIDWGRFPADQIAFSQDSCWKGSYSPLAISGSYASASLPKVIVDDVIGARSPIPVSYTMSLNAPGLSDYSGISGKTPTSIIGDQWNWSVDSSTNPAQAQDTTDTFIGINSAVNGVSQAQSTNTDLLSGLLWGFAGACCIAFLQELRSARSRDDDT